MGKNGSKAADVTVAVWFPLPVVLHVGILTKFCARNRLIEIVGCVKFVGL